MRKFLKSSFGVIEDDIDAAQKEGEFAFVVFYSHKDSIELKPHNIPPELMEKFKGCLTQDDMDYIHESIYRKLFGRGSES